MTKKIAIIGKGTAGSQSIIHYLRHLPNCEIEWYFDDNIPTQSVGEGSTLTLPTSLFGNINFNFIDLDKIDSTLKIGIFKSGWGKKGTDFLHSFPAPNVGMHFNAKALQGYIYEKVKNKVKIINKNVKNSEVDANYIVDCSGKPDSYELFHQSSYIPVNAAYITQCYWEYPKFQYTLTIARPYGWVFGIPLKNRCSIGYIFNKDINNVNEIKNDVKNIFKEYKLRPSNTTNYLEFNNYHRKVNYTERVAYNGNTSFFLEPLEASSIAMMNVIQRGMFDLIQNNSSVDQLNLNYLQTIKEIEVMIMLHYFSGSIYDTNFWKFAQKRGVNCIENALKTDSKFVSFITHALQKKQSNLTEMTEEYGSWSAGSFCENLSGLGIESIMSLLWNSYF